MATVDLGALRPQFLVGRYTNFMSTVTLGAVALPVTFTASTDLTTFTMTPDNDGTLTLTPAATPTLTLTPGSEGSLTLTPA